MKRILILMLAFVCMASGIYGQKKTVAVYVSGGQEGANDMLSASLKEAITKSKDYVAVERTASFLQQLRKEQKYQRSGSVDDSDIARLGRESGAKYVCVAEIMPVSGGDFVTARLIGVENASVIATADGSEKITNLEMLMRTSESIAVQLLQNAAKNQSGKSKARVAVYITGEDGDGTNKVLGAKLVSAITKSVQYAAMERTDAFLQQLQDEQNYQTSGYVDDNQLAALGRQFGVQYVCAAKVSKAYGSKALTVSLIDVETAEVTAISKAALSGSDVNSLIKVTQKISKEIAGKTEEEAEAEAQAKAKAEAEAKTKAEAKARAEAEAEAKAKAETEAKEKAEAAKKRAIESIAQNMVYVQGGTFKMGCPREQRGDCQKDEKPAHKVMVSNFYISKYEITQAQWEAIMETTIKQQQKKANSSGSLYGEGDNYPMYYVNWEEARDFIRRLNAATGKQYRLPTEAEWEYAARGGNQSRGYKYSGSNYIEEVACYTSNSGNNTHPVGTKKANELGIYDMSGNVWEWCYDYYNSKYYKKKNQTNPSGASSGSGRVYRGGSWGDDAGNCRVASRGSSPGHRSNYLGFRIACSSK